jgi:hypothetical protein
MHSRRQFPFAGELGQHEPKIANGLDVAAMVIAATCNFAFEMQNCT